MRGNIEQQFSLDVFLSSARQAATQAKTSHPPLLLSKTLPSFSAICPLSPLHTPLTIIVAILVVVESGPSFYYTVALFTKEQPTFSELKYIEKIVNWRR